ncbi:MAG: DUF2061 domain-containing protein [Vicinamibacterales bacterium]|jgi:adenylylsulfate kinase|nr:DUF2061 domain-containing protein [Vicinamibacterales bacterium]
MFEESATRSIIKAVSWRILATLTTTLLVYAVTGSTEFAVTIGAFEAVAKMALYFIHERAWNRLDIGRKPSRGSAQPAVPAAALPTGEYR